MIQQNIPLEINDILTGESADFIVKSKRKVPPKKAKYLIGFGLFWLAFISIFVAVFFGPVLLGKEVHFKSSGVPTVAGPDNLSPLIGPGIMMVFFIFIGVVIILKGSFDLFSEGGWIISTEKRLIVYEKKQTKSYDWEQFSGEIEATGTQEKGSLTVFLRTGHIAKRGRQRFEPDTIYISGIRNSREIEQKLRERIKENDPTPPKTL